MFSIQSREEMLASNIMKDDTLGISYIFPNTHLSIYYRLSVKT